MEDHAARHDPPSTPDPPDRRAAMGDAPEVQYHLMVDKVHDYAIFLMDADGVIIHWGEGATRIKEFTADEVLGRHLSALYPEGGSEDGTAEEHLRAAREQGEYVGEGLRRARDRGLFPARVVLTALWRGGELVGYSKVTQDLSERRDVESALREAVRAAEAANVEKSRFLATMSHEIRTPINAILGYADLLDVGVAGPLTDRQRDFLTRLRSSGRHLLSLLEDVLDFARVEAGRLAVELRPNRAGATVAGALGLVRSLAETRRLALSASCEGDADVEYWGDEQRVRQILVNLLGNAVKFTEPGGRIAVRCGTVAEAAPDAQLPGPGPWACFEVEDTGIGIAAADLAAVFEPFVQLGGGLTRTHEGSGLGLAISRRLARLMHGDLTTRSRPGEGSTFTLWLPTVPPPRAAADRRPEETAAPLTRIARHLGAAAPHIVAAAAERIRVDPAVPAARDRSLSELEDHLPTLVVDMAQALIVIEQDGPDSSAIAQDGIDVQTLLARRHGKQRRRLGWTEAGLHREYEILRGEIDVTVQNVDASIPEAARAEALAIVARLLGSAENESLRALRGG